MNLNYLFEELNLDKHKITNDHIYAIANELTDEQIQEQITCWLSGLDRHHQVSGRIIGAMMGIADISLKNIPLSRKQQVFAISNLIRYWDQIGIESRAQMML